MADAWSEMDLWLKRHGEYIGRVTDRMLASGVPLTDPEYRRLLGKSQMIGQMRPFIHGAKSQETTP